MFTFTRLRGATVNRLNKLLQDSAMRQIRTSAAVVSNRGVMFSKEEELPHLPVPELKQTMQKYIAALEPISFEHDLKNTEKIVEEFSKPGGVGEQLQAKLMEKAASTDNWLSEWWDRCAYFGYRDPVMIHSSPAVKFPDQTFLSDVDQFRYTAKLIHKVLAFKNLVDTESIPVDHAGKDPLTMVQYKKLLSYCRVPLANCDKDVYTPPDESKHVIVAHNNHFFSLDVYKEGTHIPLTEDELVQQLATIVNESQTENEYPVGVLTSGRRNVWAQAYKSLTRDSKNQDNIDKIEKSICLICLDQPIDIPEVSDSGFENERSSVSVRQMLHGGGSSQNGMNRWYDKICQFIVNRNGLNGICYEHSGAEGPPVLALCNMIMDIKLENDDANVVDIVNKNLSKPVELSWNLTYDMMDRVELAIDNVDDAAGNLELRLFQFDKFGKNVPKQFKVSPDAFFQVCLQLAYWRLYSHHPPTYESASIRKFARGRTECIRSATTAAGRFSREMDRKNYDASGKRDLFMKAIQAHVNYTIDAMNFRAVDRHMLGLKLIAMENGIPLPEIFRDQCYGYSTHFRLSTSQVASKHEACLCFGPVVPDGYGVCYNPMETQIIYSVSSFLSHPKTRSKDFGDAIAQALLDIHQLLSSQSKL